MKLYEIVFSPTGRTQKAAEAISSVWDVPKMRIDLTKPDFNAAGYHLEQEDICIVASGVYGGRLPAPAAQRLVQISGNGASAILVAAYGNRAVDDCLAEMYDILSAQGFRCRAAVEAVVEHSMMPGFGAGRPDAQDRAQLTDFANQIKTGLENGTLSDAVQVPGNRPYSESSGMPLSFKANRKCTKCGKCAALCPVGAIPKEDPASCDATKCICCMRCTVVCPTGAKAMPGVMKLAAPLLGKKMGLDGHKENKLYL